MITQRHIGWLFAISFLFADTTKTKILAINYVSSLLVEDRSGALRCRP